MVAAEILVDIPFFGEFDGEERAPLAPLTNRRHYAAGEMIFSEDTSPDFLRVLVRGLVSFRQRQFGDDSDILMGTASEPGDVFGISAMVGDDARYLSSAVCLAETDVIEIDANKLITLCQDRPGVGVHILQRLAAVMAQRLANAREQIRSRIRPGLISHG